MSRENELTHADHDKTEDALAILTQSARKEDIDSSTMHPL